MIIDAHTHNSKDLIASMNEAEIDYSILIDNSPTEDGTDQIIKICEENPRLKAVGSVFYPTIDENQIQKLINYLTEEKIHGIKLYPGYENFYPTSEKLFKLYEECQKLNKPVVFHTGILMSGVKGLLKQSHPLNIDEVANNFPNLKIVMAHFGNPWIMDSAAVVSKNENVYVDLSGYFTENASIAKEEIDLFIKKLTEFKIFTGNFKKCLFGTDYPSYSQKEYLKAVKNLPLTEEEKELVFWKNANEIFNLKIQ